MLISDLYSRPINITNLCKLTATAPNTVSVSWAVEVGKSYTVSVYLVDNLNYQDLLNRLVYLVDYLNYQDPLNRFNNGVLS